MRVITLPDDLFTYLTHVVRTYAGNGINPEEGLGLYHLNEALKRAQTYDEEKLKQMAEEEKESVVQPPLPSPEPDEFV